MDPHTNDLTRKLNNESDLKHQSLIMAPDVQPTLCIYDSLSLSLLYVYMQCLSK